MQNRQLVLYTAVSLDGYIAREDGNIDWLPTGEEENYGFTSFEESVDKAVMGFNTYWKVREFPGNPFHKMPHYILTRKTDLPQDDRVVFVNQDLKTFFKEQLSRKNGKGIWIMGGGKLIMSMVKEGICIDEWRLFIIPVILGGGIPLFPEGIPETWLLLKEVNTYKSGVVQITYMSKN